MATDRLNDRQIRLAKPTEKEYLLSDGQGLFLRVRPEGGKDWLFVFTFAGKRRKMGLGRLHDVPLATARKERDKARDALTQQIDPQLQQRKNEAEQVAQMEAMRAREARLTVTELFERWVRVELSRRKDNGAEICRAFTKDVLPKLGNLAAEDVRRTQIAATLDAVVERGARIVARNMLGDIRQMYGFAIARGLVENDPTSHMKRDDYGRKVERERVLSEAEIKLLYAAMPNAKLAKANEFALWIQLATACRIGELLQARWEHIDFDAGIWRTPQHIAKNNKEHIVALSDFALEKFKALKAINGKKSVEHKDAPCEWVMPARLTSSHIDLKTLSKQVADRQRGAKEAMSNRSPHRSALVLPGGKWTPHDLRRTAATLMVSLGVQPEVVEKCLNHVEQNIVKRIYQRHSYAAEMKQAWKLLGERLDLLTCNQVGNVVPIRGTATT
jgi:integrase